MIVSCSNGNFGWGTYFADDPRKSHAYAPANLNGERNMFVCKVLLGKIQDFGNQASQNRTSADRGYHSIYGNVLNYPEYIVYRFGQAIPLLV